LQHLKWILDKKIMKTMDIKTTKIHSLNQLSHKPQLPNSYLYKYVHSDKQKVLGPWNPQQ